MKFESSIEMALENLTDRCGVVHGNLLKVYKARFYCDTSTVNISNKHE